MPKMKTSKTAAKRFRKTGSGKLQRQQAMRQHLFEKKPSTRTRRLDGTVDVHSGDVKRVQRLLGERMGREVFMYSITLDTRQDTPAVLARYAELAGVGPHWKLLTGRHTDIERLRRALRYTDIDPEVDRDRTQHTGMVRVGNDALDRWISCPGLAPAEQLARQAVRIGRASGQQPAAAA